MAKAPFGFGITHCGVHLAHSRHAAALRKADFSAHGTRDVALSAVVGMRRVASCDCHTNLCSSVVMVPRRFQPVSCPMVTPMLLSAVQETLQISIPRGESDAQGDRDGAAAASVAPRPPISGAASHARRGRGGPLKPGLGAVPSKEVPDHFVGNVCPPLLGPSLGRIQSY